MLIAHIGVVVESFSYVYQTRGGAKAITQEETRAFKKIWEEFANSKTGFLERPQFVPFFRVGAVLLDASCNSIDARSVEIGRYLRSPHLSNRVQRQKHLSDLCRQKVQARGKPRVAERYTVDDRQRGYS
jgi:hypothetical protein